jgi:hypothetical protein
MERGFGLARQVSVMRGSGQQTVRIYKAKWCIATKMSMMATGTLANEMVLGKCSLQMVTCMRVNSNLTS